MWSAPRVCGDDPSTRWATTSTTSSAPRVCGDDPNAEQIANAIKQVLPAYAGMIPTTSTRHISRSTCSPRMRG